MYSITELTIILQEEYSKLDILDEDIFKGEPALTTETDWFLIALSAPEDENYSIYFEDYETGYVEETAFEGESVDEIFQQLLNFTDWLTHKKKLSSQSVASLQEKIITPIKQAGFTVEPDLF